MKKFTAVSIAFFILLSTVSVFAETDVFSDVPSDHWAHDAVLYFYNRDVVDGVGDKRFDPDGFVTREQFAKLIAIIYNKIDYIAEKQSFSDVTADRWSYNYIEAVKAYLTGYFPADGEAFFNPTGKASREDVAYALVKISGLEAEIKENSMNEKFKDENQISAALKPYVAIAAEKGLIYGYEGYFRPQDGITRAETVSLLFRAIKKPVSGDEIINTEPEEIIEKAEDKAEAYFSYEYGNPEDFDEPSWVKTSDYIVSGRYINHFKLKISDTEIIEKSSLDSIKGFITISFGEDFVKDTKVKAKVLVDEDEYIFEAVKYQSFSNYGGWFRVIADFNIYKNDILIIESKPLMLEGNRRDNYLELASVLSSVNVYWSEKSLPKSIKSISEDPILDELISTGSNTTVQVKSLNKESAVGDGIIRYKKDKNISKIDISFVSKENKYEIVLSELKEISEDAITGLFDIKLNGELIKSKTNGKIADYQKSSGESVNFSTDDGSIDVYMIITSNIF